jgi:hypothetical protein
VWGRRALPRKTFALRNCWAGGTVVVISFPLRGPYERERERESSRRGGGGKRVLYSSSSVVVDWPERRRRRVRTVEEAEAAASFRAPTGWTRFFFFSWIFLFLF